MWENDYIYMYMLYKVELKWIYTPTHKYKEKNKKPHTEVNPQPFTFILSFYKITAHILFDFKMK